MKYSFRKRIVGFFLLLFCGEIIFSCKSSSKEEVPKQNTIVSGEKKIDSSSNDLNNLTDTAIKKHFLKLRQLLNFDMELKLNEEEIRIWLEYSYSDSGKVILLKRRGKIWNSIAYYYKSYKNNDNELVAIDKESEIKKPVAGWDDILEELKKIGVYKLRDYTEIPNYFLSTGGDAVVIEIENGEMNRICAYPNYKEYKDEVTEVNNIIKLLNLLQKQFGYRLDNLSQ